MSDRNADKQKQQNLKGYLKMPKFNPRTMNDDAPKSVKIKKNNQQPPKKGTPPLKDKI